MLIAVSSQHKQPNLTFQQLSKCNVDFFSMNLSVFPQWAAQKKSPNMVYRRDGGQDVPWDMPISKHLVTGWTARNATAGPSLSLFLFLLTLRHEIARKPPSVWGQKKNGRYPCGHLVFLVRTWTNTYQKQEMHAMQTNWNSLPTRRQDKEAWTLALVLLPRLRSKSFLCLFIRLIGW